MEKREQAFSVPEHARDVNSKEIFKNPRLCSQFLQDNMDIPQLKWVQPEDIEDVTERYQAYFGVEFETDTVKKIRLKDENGKPVAVPLYMISLIEHKSSVDHDIMMQLLRYMTCIWHEYAKEMERKKKGISQRKDFQYPPILPIVYYEGSGKWTASRYLRDRIQLAVAENTRRELEFKVYIASCKEFQCTKQDTTERLIHKFGERLSEAQTVAAEIVNRYWDEI